VSSEPRVNSFRRQLVEEPDLSLVEGMQPPQPRDVRGERLTQPLTSLVREIRLIHGRVAA